MLKFHVQEYERCLHVIMPACSKAIGRHIEQTFAILDVKGEAVAPVLSFGAGIIYHACPCKGMVDDASSLKCQVGKRQATFVRLEFKVGAGRAHTAPPCWKGI